MPDDYLSFLPVVVEDADSVRARFDVDANAGLNPRDARYTDTTPGGFYWDLTQVAVLEAVRLWDFLGTEMVAAMFPGTAWGEWLDLHGETIALPRKDEAPATGEVVFAAEVGTLVPAGTVVSTEVEDPALADESVEFITDLSITIAPSPGPTNLAAVVSASGGSLSALTRYYKITALLAKNPAWNVLSANESGIETDATGWVNNANATVARDSGVSLDALASLRLTSVAAGDMSAVLVSDRATVPGDTWTASARFHAAVTARTVRIALQYRDAGNAVLSTVTSPDVVDATGAANTVNTWIKNSVTGVAPVGATKVRVLLIVVGTAAANEVHYMDRIKLGVGDDPGNVETVASNEVSATTPTGTTGSVTLTWSPVTDAVGYKIYRRTVTLGETLIEEGGARTSYLHTGAPAAVGISPAPTNRVTVTAADAGARGNVAAGMVVLVLSPVVGAPSVTNPSAMSGGADVESDALYRGRILQAYGAPQGAGTAADYERWALEDPSVGFAFVEALWNGPGTVRVTITDPDNKPVSQTVVDRLQTRLDPVPQQGAGDAPIGALVTVATPSVLTVDVSGTVTFSAGYSLDGAAGTVPMRQAIIDSLARYFGGLRPGDDVILNHVIGQFFLVPGVLDVATVKLNNGTVNVAVGSLQVAALGAVTLT